MDNIKKCKKCGTELPDDYKYDMCDNCRRENAGILRKIVFGIGGLLAAVLAFVGVSQQSKISSQSADTNQDDESA